MSKRICNCVGKSDVELDRLAKILRADHAKLGRVGYRGPSDRVLVDALAVLEATDHRVTCVWYRFFLEMCERKWWTRSEK